MDLFVPTRTVGALAQYVPHAATARAMDRVMAKIVGIKLKARMMTWQPFLYC